MNSLRKTSPSPASTPPSGTEKGGRPTVMTPAVQRAVIKSVSSGMPVKHAAEKLGISPATLYRFRMRDETFRTLLSGARAKFLNRHVENVERIASDQDGNNSAHSLRASMFLLERCFPHEFAQRKHLEIDQSTTENRTLTVNVLDSGAIVKDALSVLKSRTIDVASTTTPPTESTRLDQPTDSTE